MDNANDNPSNSITVHIKQDFDVLDTKYWYFIK